MWWHDKHASLPLPSRQGQVLERIAVRLPSSEPLGRRSVLRAGAFAFLLKSFRPEELISAVDQLLTV